MKAALCAEAFSPVSDRRIHVYQSMSAGLQRGKDGIAQGGVVGIRPVAAHAVGPGIGVGRARKYEVRLTGDGCEGFAVVGL